MHNENGRPMDKVTSGYGNIYPKTAAGKMLTCLYSIFGIPLVLAILNDLGKYFCKWGNYSYTNLKRGFKRVYRSFKPDKVHSEKGPTVSNSNGKMVTSVISTISSSPSNLDDCDMNTMPVSMALFLCFGWMLLCAWIFCWFEKWKYYESFYFFFISLSTIGLGDYTPSKPEYMIGAFAFVIIGLSLVSMTINVIQQKIEDWMNDMIEQMKEEYLKALEMGEGPEKDEILAKLMKNQPWYLQKLMPNLMGEKQMQVMENAVEREMEKEVAQFKNLTTNTKEVQTTNLLTMDKSAGGSGWYQTMDVSVSPRSPDWLMDRSLMCMADTAEQHTSMEQLSKSIISTQTFSAQDETGMQTSGPCLLDMSLQTSYCEPLMAETQMQTSLVHLSPKEVQTLGPIGLPVDRQVQVKPTKIKQKAISMQTSIIELPEPPALIENQMQTSVVKSAPKCIQTQGPQGLPVDRMVQVAFKAHPKLKRQQMVDLPKGVDRWVQTAELKTQPPVQNANAETQTSIECVVITLPALKNIRMQEGESSPPTPSMTDSWTESQASQTESSDISDIEIQTDDSYLKIAKKLEALRCNRTKSLAVMSLPKFKPPPPDVQVAAEPKPAPGPSKSPSVPRKTAISTPTKASAGTSTSLSNDSPHQLRAKKSTVNVPPKIIE